MERPTCKTCPYFSVETEDECRRLPPQVDGTIAQLFREDDGRTQWDDGIWPRTRPDDWCGEHPRFKDYLASLEANPSDSPR